ncbi:MAG: Gfo/Idh/MocA family oxidoreductase, partial [Pirellulales bacterium]
FIEIIVVPTLAYPDRGRRYSDRGPITSEVILMSDSAPASFEHRSRRDFIKTSSIAAAGALAGGLTVAQSAYAGGSDELKIGLVGCGGRGSGAADDALSANQGVKITAVADAFEDRLKGTLSGLKSKWGDRVEVPKECQFVGFDGYKYVLGAGVDLVILATPPGFRPIHFAAAVAANKHVFMEKPVAVDAPGVRQVLSAADEARKKGLGVGVGLQRRHENSYIETIRRLREGAIGDIQFTRVYWNGDGVWVRGRKAGQTEMEYQMRNWYYFTWLSGDHIAEQHIHNLDVGNWLMRDEHPVSAQGMGGREVRKGKDHGEIYDHHYVEFTYKNGAKMFSHCRHIPRCWGSVSEHAHGTKGTSDVNGRIDGEKKWRYEGPRANPYVVEHADLVASIRAGKPLAEGHYGAMSSMTAIFGRMATYSGKMLNWDQAINSKISLAPESYAWDAMPRVVPDENGNYPIAVPGVTEVV